MPRFWAKVDKRGPDECWLWTASLVHDGYGRFKGVIDGERFVRAHRFAYRTFVGPIPSGFPVDHLCHTDECSDTVACDHRRCVNPAHLAATSQRENILRGNTRASVNACKTECKRGHPLNAGNTTVYPDGRRECKTCRRASHQRQEAKRRERRRLATP